MKDHRMGKYFFAPSTRLSPRMPAGAGSMTRVMAVFMISFPSIISGPWGRKMCGSAALKELRSRTSSSTRSASVCSSLFAATVLMRTSGPLNQEFNRPLVILLQTPSLRLCQNSHLTLSNIRFSITRLTLSPRT